MLFMEAGASELIHYCLKIQQYRINGLREQKTVSVVKVVLKQPYREIILTGIDNDIYSTVDACPNACEMWKAIERLKQGESINVMNGLSEISVHVYKSSSGMSVLTSITTRMAKNEVNEIRAERLAHTANPLALVAQQQPVYHHQNHPTQNTQYSPPDRKQSTSIREKAIVTSSAPIMIQNLLGTPVVQKSGIQCYNCKDLQWACIKGIKLKCEIDDSKNRNKFLESSNKELVDKLKGEIEDFKTKNNSLESSNNHFKEANNELSKTNQLMFKDLKKFQAELDKYNDVNYASKVEIDCAKAKGDLMSYKIEFEKSSNAYTRKINDLNQMISDMKKELCAHQETISIMSQAKEAQIKLYKTREDKELDKVIALENKVKVLNDIVYKTGQSVQTMNMLNRNCKTSFAKPEFLKKAQRANPRLYDIGCYNDNLALMLAPDSDETIRVIPNTRVSRPQLKSNNLEDRVMSNNSQGKKQEVKDHRPSNVNFVCVTCGKCVLNDNHDLCVLHYINGVNSRTRQPMAVPLVEIILFIVDSGCSKHMTGNLKLLTNFVEKFLGTVKFGNDQIVPILGYGDLFQGTITIKRVYYVEGLNYNLFSVGQFCDADLEVAFRKSTCYIGIIRK
ncbi:hypothetical protein Tco_1069414 [Tanacetum coccineum]|uniref:Retrovirus-related Pol polyprotein from transposon TNT 1-94-like beta-barrel domain-containing protein n=1 Tax=Tanacetum coccineum TaxID=301880 RepID=A0ABQ5HKE8_9ASTR